MCLCLTKMVMGASSPRPRGRGIIEEGIYGAIMTDTDLKEARPIYGPLLSIFLYGVKVLLFYYFWIVDRRSQVEEGPPRGLSDAELRRLEEEERPEGSDVNVVALLT